MPDHSEFETGELQEQIQEMHEKRHEQEEEAKRSGWTRYIGLSTAVLAVFAAVGALRSSYFVNEALINQVKAADSWTQYQAARQKDHLYSLMLNNLLDANPSNPQLAANMLAVKPAAKVNPETLKPGKHAGPPVFKAKTAPERGSEYLAKIYDEVAKEQERSTKATELETESKEQIHKHHQFEYSVGIIQVAIALGAIAAMIKAKPVWFLSLGAGAVGIALFIYGFVR